MACMNYMRETGMSYPKACEDCGLGPCKYPQHVKAAPEVKYPYYTAAELELIRQAGGPPPPGAIPAVPSQPPLKKWQPRVVQIASVHGNLHVLYDDGELWMSRNDGTWRRLALPR